MQAGIKTIAAVAVLYLVYCGILYLVQRHLLFPTSLLVTDPEAWRPFPNLEKQHIPFENGTVELWYLPSGKNGKSPLVIIAHGNAEVIDFLPAEFRRFNELGLSVLLIEYPGYGRSAGSPSQESIDIIYKAAYDRFSKRTDIDPHKIVLMGRSLGGGVVCSLSAGRPSAALILISTFSSARSFAWKYLAPPFLVKDPFDNLAVLRDYTNPVLIIHGRQDDIIPYAHARRLQAAAQTAKLISYSCGHNDCPPDPTRFWKDVENFLQGAAIL
jgi:fermentation-respiration switch protein FrsA (DUF1100 family)